MSSNLDVAMSLAPSLEYDRDEYRVGFVKDFRPDFDVEMWVATVKPWPNGMFSTSNYSITAQQFDSVQADIQQFLQCILDVLIEQIVDLGPPEADAGESR